MNIKKVEPALQPLQTKKKVAAYCRVSDEDLLNSLSQQVSYYSEYIQANPEWDYAGVYADEGISGTSTERRPEFIRLISDCDAGKIDVVLTKSISRFARDTVDCLYCVRHLKSIGVDVRFEREKISTMTADGELLLTLLASFAQAESESISKNIKWAIRKNFQEGKSNCHNAPYGYEWDGEIYRAKEEQAKVVKEIFDRYTSGQTPFEIARALKGIPTRDGKEFTDWTVKDIVTNMSYTGIMLLQKNYIDSNHKCRKNKGELPMYAVEDMYEPIVSQEEFDKAQEIFKQRSSLVTHMELTKYSGLMRCGYCQHSVSRRKQNKWVCNERERKQTCDLRPLYESELDEAAQEALGNISDDEFRKEVESVVVFGDHIEFRLYNGKTKFITRTYSSRYGPFSGKLVCGHCGKNLIRKTRKNKKGEIYKTWMCGKHKALKETELIEATKSFINSPDYEPVFVELVGKVEVFDDKLQFYFKDGDKKIWQRK